MFSHIAQQLQLPTAEQRQSTLEVLQSGIDALDQLLPCGGFVGGQLAEITGNSSCGKRTLATALCANVLAAGKRAAWVDGTGQFYPLLQLEFGVPLARLLVIRAAVERPSERDRRETHHSETHHSETHHSDSNHSDSNHNGSVDRDHSVDRRVNVQPANIRRFVDRHQPSGPLCLPVLKAVDILLQNNGAVSLIIVDLPPQTKVPPRLLARLKLSAEQSGVAIVFLTEQIGRSFHGSSSLGTFISLQLRIKRQSGTQLGIVVAKSKNGKMAHQAVVTIDEPHSVSLASTI
ncbi:MAG: hypothetical protein H6707_04855 [Deltaproteobacteria bacterium]|nr:hypothetical protein [Deltaproteobacteria bacterium]